MAHIDPVAHADQYFGAMHAAQHEREKAQDQMAACFIKACARADANAMADFAPMVRDWDAAKHLPVSIGAHMPRRYQTVAEVMQESLDYSSGPSMTEAMQLILNVAYGTDLVNAPAQARALLDRMATTFATYNHAD